MLIRTRLAPSEGPDLFVTWVPVSGVVAAARSGAKKRRMDEIYETFCALDDGKSEHCAAALNATGERVFDKPLPQD